MLIQWRKRFVYPKYERNVVKTTETIFKPPQYLIFCHAPERKKSQPCKVISEWRTMRSTDDTGSGSMRTKQLIQKGGNSEGWDKWRVLSSLKHKERKEKKRKEKKDRKVRCPNYLSAGGRVTATGSTGLDVEGPSLRVLGTSGYLTAKKLYELANHE